MCLFLFFNAYMFMDFTSLLLFLVFVSFVSIYSVEVKYTLETNVTYLGFIYYVLFSTVFSYEILICFLFPISTSILRLIASLFFSNIWLNGSYTGLNSLDILSHTHTHTHQKKKTRKDNNNILVTELQFQ